MSEATKLSQEAHDRLAAELEELTTQGRVRIAEDIEAARALGDLSENGDYQAAKDEQGVMETRIRQLEAMLKDVEIVEAPHGNRVGHGSIVSLQYEGDDEEETYLVGSLEERHEDYEVLSPESPLGQALLGAAKGSTVRFEAPTGELQVTVTDVQ